MNEIDFDLDNPAQISGPLTLDDTVTFTAVPKDFGAPGVDLDLVTDQMEFGTMNEADAIESGYISGAKADVVRTITERTTVRGGWINQVAILVGVAFLGWTAMRALSWSRTR